MKWTSVLAIYFLIFCFSAFLLLPFAMAIAGMMYVLTTSYL